MGFQTPVLEYALLAPILIVLAGAVIGVLIEALAPRTIRPIAQLSVTLGSLIIALVQTWLIRGENSESVALGAVMFDGAGALFQISILIMAILAVLLIADQDNFTAVAAALPGSEEESAGLAQGFKLTEVFPLTLFAVSGMLYFPIATDLISLFVALEVFSLPLYLMSGLSRRRRLLSQEAALKYFLLGSFASAFFLFGAAFLYGYSGSISLSGIRASVVGGSGNDVILMIGLVFVSVGLLFKVGAVPFHSWTPDVYQGAPTPVTGFMAAATKVAAFAAMLRIYYTTFANAEWSWRPILIVIAIITMIFGSIVAIAQRDVKRMLAYSSIAHAGFLLTGVIALNKSGLDASIFYLLTYGISTIGAFAIVTLVRDSAGEITDLNRWAGLAKRSPLIAGTFALFLLTFAGIPLTAGFIGKFSIFSAVYENGGIWLVLTGVMSSAIAAFFYIRVIVLMFFKEPSDDSTSVVIPSIFTQLTIAVAAIVTLILGIFPQPVINLINSLALFVR